MIALVSAPLHRWMASEEKTVQLMPSGFLILVCLLIGIVLLHLSHLLSLRSFRYLLSRP